MKKINLVFSLILAVVLLAGFVHVGVVMAQVANDPMTGFPVEASFIFLVPYVIGAAVVAAVWLTVFLVKKYKGKREKK